MSAAAPIAGTADGLQLAPARSEDRRAVRDSLIVTLGGQIGRALGTLTALALRWGLDPSRLGAYGGLRICLDQTNRTSLGIGLGAVQEIPLLCAAGRHDEARRVADVAHTATALTCASYALALLGWAALRAPFLAGDPLVTEWTWGLVAVATLTPCTASSRSGWPCCGPTGSSRSRPR